MPGEGAERAAEELFEDGLRFFRKKGYSEAEARAKATAWSEAQLSALTAEGIAAHAAGATAKAARVAEVATETKKAEDLYGAAADALRALTARLAESERAAARVAEPERVATATIREVTPPTAGPELVYESLRAATMRGAVGEPRPTIFGRILRALMGRPWKPAEGIPWYSTVAEEKTIEGPGGVIVQRITRTIPSPAIATREELLAAIADSSRRVEGGFDALSAAERQRAAAAAAAPGGMVPSVELGVEAARGARVPMKAPGSVPVKLTPGAAPPAFAWGPAKVLSFGNVTKGVALGSVVIGVGGTFMFMAWAYQERGSVSGMGSFTASKADRPDLMDKASADVERTADAMDAAVRPDLSHPVQAVGTYFYSLYDVWANYPDALRIGAEANRAMADKMRKDQAAAAQGARPTRTGAPTVDLEHLSDAEFGSLSRKEKAELSPLKGKPRREWIDAWRKLHGTAAPTPAPVVPSPAPPGGAAAPVPTLEELGIEEPPPSTPTEPPSRTSPTAPSDSSLAKK